MSRFHSLCGRWMIWSRHICWRRQCPKFLGPRGNYRGLLPDFRDLPSLQMILQFAASFRTAEVWHRHSDRLFRKIRPNSATRWNRFWPEQNQLQQDWTFRHSFNSAAVAPSKETTFAAFLEWLFSEDHMRIMQPVVKAQWYMKEGNEWSMNQEMCMTGWLTSALQIQQPKTFGNQGSVGTEGVLHLHKTYIPAISYHYQVFPRWIDLNIYRTPMGPIFFGRKNLVLCRFSQQSDLTSQRQAEQGKAEASAAAKVSWHVCWSTFPASQPT